MLDQKLITELEEYIKTRHRVSILLKQNYYEPFTINTQKWLDAGWCWQDITEVLADMDPMYEDYAFHKNDAERTIVVV